MKHKNVNKWWHSPAENDFWKLQWGLDWALKLPTMAPPAGEEEVTNKSLLVKKQQTKQLHPEVQHYVLSLSPWRRTVWQRGRTGRKDRSPTGTVHHWATHTDKEPSTELEDSGVRSTEYRVHSTQPNTVWLTQGPGIELQTTAVRQEH